MAKDHGAMRVRRWHVMLGVALTAAAGLGPAHRRTIAAPLATAPRPPFRAAGGPDLVAMPAPTRQDRVLVLAPHCDDETIGGGGYLATAARAGAAVRVVVATCGEGFSSAAQRLYGEKEITPKQYLELAATRKSECLAAVRELGIKAEQVSFLGYPDRGLAEMWLRNWSPSQPYTSSYTGLSSSPFADSHGRKAAYCGRSVLDGLKQTMEEFRPTIVLCPHPSDLHGDHWALYCYTVGALYEAGMLGRTEVRAYLVHQQQWPPMEEQSPSEWLLPPAALTGQGWTWLSLPLGEEIRGLKEAALRQHVTQMQARGRHLLGYLRGNELFGVVDGLMLPPAPGNEAGPVRDGRGDVLISEAPTGADLLAVWAESDGKRLSLRLELAEASAPDVEYQVDVHALNGHKVGPPESHRLKVGEHTGSIQCGAEGREVSLSIPWPLHAEDGAMFSVSTWVGHRVVDRTPWAVVRAGVGGG